MSLEVFEKLESKVQQAIVLYKSHCHRASKFFCLLFIWIVIGY